MFTNWYDTEVHDTEVPACAEQVIAKKRAEKPEVRKASREAALREVSGLAQNFCGDIRGSFRDI